MDAFTDRLFRHLAWANTFDLWEFADYEGLGD